MLVDSRPGCADFLPKRAAMRIAVIHGVNLSLLGEREPATYGTMTLAQLDAEIERTARELGLTVTTEQYEGEGEIVCALHRARLDADGVVLNPGAYAHYSYAIADAIASIAIPVVEVHLSNTAAREEFRRRSVTAAACRGVVAGFGADSYRLALAALAKKP